MSALTETAKDLGAIIAACSPVAVGLWAWMREVQRKASDKVDAANKERDMWAARWAREVEYGAQRAVEPAPRKLPRTLPPPAFMEPEDVRTKREELEKKRLEKIRQGEADAELDRTLTQWLDQMKSVPPPRA